MIRNEEAWLRGVALRPLHFSEFIKKNNQFSLIEVVSENYMFFDNEEREFFLEIAKHSKTHLHGVSGNIGGFDPFQKDWLRELKRLHAQTAPILISDHLCYTQMDGRHTFELLPLPMTKKMVDHIGQRINRLRDHLGQDFLLENISRYFQFSGDEMSEVEFMNALHDRYQIHFLLDVNNVFVSSQNLKFSPESFIKDLLPQAVQAYHVAGFEWVEGFPFDTHGAPVSSEVQRLLSMAVECFGMKPLILERDENIPVDLRVLENEVLALTEDCLL